MRGVLEISYLHAGIDSPSVPVSHFTRPTLAHFTMPPPPLSPPIEEDPELTENEQWEAAALAATIEAFAEHERQQEEMHKRRCVEELEQLF